MLPKDCRWKAIKDLQGAHPPGFFEKINQPRQRQAQCSLFVQLTSLVASYGMSAADYSGLMFATRITLP
jgi:hypothetical protein